MHDAGLMGHTSCICRGGESNKMTQVASCAGLFPYTQTHQQDNSFTLDITPAIINTLIACAQFITSNSLVLQLCSLFLLKAA